MADEEMYNTIGKTFLARVGQRLAELDPSTLTPDELVKWTEVALKLDQAGRRRRAGDGRRARVIEQQLREEAGDDDDTA